MIQLESRSGCAILRLHGSFFGDQETIDLDRTFERLHAEGVRRLAVDFSRVQAFNSVAFGVLIKAVVRMRPEGGRMALFGFVRRGIPAFKPPAALYDTLWTEFEDEDAAVAALTAPPATP